MEGVGYGSSWVRGDDWFLASLFVDQAAHGQGVGTALLDAVWTPATRRRTMTDAIQPISNALYGGRGLVPATPLLTFLGRPQIEAPLAQGAGAADLRRIDELAYGFDREVDHLHWSRHAVRTEWPDAYSYAFPDGEIGPVAGATPAAAAAALAGRACRGGGDRARLHPRLGPPARRGRSRRPLAPGARSGAAPAFTGGRTARRARAVELRPLLTSTVCSPGHLWVSYTS